MKVFFAVLALVSGCLWLVSCSGSGTPLSPSSTVAAERAFASRGVERVPFKGRFEGTQTRTPLTPPFAQIDGSATGTASHLGRFTVEFPHIVNGATLAGEGDYIFTAANGDTLTAHFTGEGQANGTIVSIVEHAIITGGTGRFAGATGSFVVEREFDRATGITHGSFEGTISSPGASKS